MTERRQRGQRRDHIQVGGIAWRAAIWLAQQAAIDEFDPPGTAPYWISTDDLAAEIDALPSTLPTRMVPLVEAGVVERREARRAGVNKPHLEWRWVAK